MAAAIGFFNLPVIDSVSIAYPCDTKDLLPWVPLPFHHGDDGTKNFRVKAILWNSVFASGRVRIKPSNCIDSLQVNGTDVPGVGQVEKAETLRCEMYYYSRLDLSQRLDRGANNVTINITNNAEGYGIDIVPIYSEQAVLAMVACLGMALYAGTQALLETSPGLLTVFRSTFGRMCVLSFVPCLGLAAMWATIVNIQGDIWLVDHIVPTLAAVIIPFALLLRLADKAGDTLLGLVRSYPAAIFSLATVAYASILLTDRGWSSYEILAIAAAGTVAGFFASIPITPFLTRIRRHPRAIAVAVVAALCPQAYWYFRLSAWVSSSDLTTAMVRGMLWICGYSTTTSAWGQKNEDGQFTEYWSRIASLDFSVSIGSWCSGFEGVSLFFFLLSAFILLDWNLFSKVTRLWAVYLVAAPYVLIVNAFRIAGLFLYAEYLVLRYNRQAAIWPTIEAFHSNIGWVVYSVAFALFLPLLYRWARRAAKVS